MVQTDNLSKVIVICGPTASGKSALAVEVAKQLNSEVIAADSLTVYKGLNIGTAKISTEETRGVKHHMLDVVDVFSNFSVGDYRELAKPIVDKLIENGKIPIICGGTGFYINSLLYNMSYGNVSANIEARERYLSLSRRFGNEYVYNILVEKDFKSAQSIHCNDIKRVVRALEIVENGTKKSDIIDEKTPVYDFHAYAYDYPRNVLYDKINKRVDDMIKNGLVDEVEHLISLGLTEKNQSLQGIGYKEIYAYLKGETKLDDAIEKIKLNSRHYAKRQITFFKKTDGLHLLQPNENIKITAQRIINEL